MKLPSTRKYVGTSGYADYFDNRRKGIFVRIARLKPSDVLYDLGCGNASLLIYAVKKRKLYSAVGFERDEDRVKIARFRINQAGLKDKIHINPNDFYEEDLSEADVIFQMLSEDSYDFRYFHSKKANIRKGTRLIKHDLPIIGYLPDKIDLPFYLMKFPLRKARSKNHWASVVLGEPKSNISQLWHEIFYYKYDKGYDKRDFDRFNSLLSSRFRKTPRNNS